MTTLLTNYSTKAAVPLMHSEERQAPDKAMLVALPDPVEVPTLTAKPRAVDQASVRTNSGASCRWYRFPVRLHPDRDDWIEVAGELATRQPLNEDTTIQVLLAGGSNNGSYWDWPLDPEKQSYVRHATTDGYATLNLDRPGYGNSDRPDPTTTDFAVQAYVVHQVTEYLRAGALGLRFRRVVLNGHSMGGMVAWHTASRFRSADAVVVSGVGHNLSEVAMKFVFDAVMPIEEHPRYGRGLGWPPGYFVRRLTPDVPKQASDWYTSMLEDTVMIAELNAISRDSRDAAITMAIDVPVLFALGQKDLRWCTSTFDCATDPTFVDEACFYRPGADFTSFLVPETGHLTNKDPGAYFFFERVTAWLRERGL